MKLLIRNVAVLCTALGLPYFRQIRQVAQGWEVLIPIGALILILVPGDETSVGAELALLMRFVLAWPFFLAFALLGIRLAPYHLPSFAVINAAALFLMLWFGFENRTWLLPVVICGLVYSTTAPTLYGFFNYNQEYANDEDRAFQAAKQLLGGATFSLFLGPIIHVLGAITIFPWFSKARTLTCLSESHRKHADLLAKLRNAYRPVCEVTLFPERQISTHRSVIDEDTLIELQSAREMEIRANLSCKATLGPTLAETRWSFDGTGMKLINLFQVGLNLSRHGRLAADELLRKIDRMKRTDTFPAPKKTAALSRETEQENKEILKLMEEINISLEIASRYSSQVIEDIRDNPIVQEPRKHLNELQTVQAKMDQECTQLKRLAIAWIKRELRQETQGFNENRRNDEPVLERTKFMTYVVILERQVEAHRRVLLHLEQASQGFYSADETSPWQKEWEETLPVFPYWDRKTWKVKDGVPMRMAFKYALGCALLQLPGFLPQTHEDFRGIRLIDALFTFQVVLIKLQAGLVIERTMQRFAGIFFGYLYSGVVMTVVHGTLFALYLFALPAVAAYLSLWLAKPSQGYIGFAFVRTYAVLSTPIVFNGQVDEIWYQGGWVMLSSMIGMALALILGLLIWPMSGRSNLRTVLADTYHDFMTLVEKVLLFHYENARENSRHGLSTELEDMETRLSQTLFVDVVPLLRSTKLETMQRINFDVEYPLYEKAVNSTRVQWQALWKLHHIGGIRVYLRDSQGNPVPNMKAATARSMFRMNRFLTSSYANVAASLKNIANPSAESRILASAANALFSLPALRPIVATPHLLYPMLTDYIVQCYQDEVLMHNILETNKDDLNLLVNLVIFRDTMYDIGESLEVMYDFLERFYNRSVEQGDDFKKRLRDQEYLSFLVFSRTPEDHDETMAPNLKLQRPENKQDEDAEIEMTIS